MVYFLTKILQTEFQVKSLNNSSNDDHDNEYAYVGFAIDIAVVDHIKVK